MKKCLIVIAVAVGVSFVILFFLKKRRDAAAMEAFSMLVGKPSHSHSIRPMQLAELGTNAVISFPPGASNVQYAVFSWGRAFGVAVRYEAPALECIRHAESLLLKGSPTETTAIERTPITGPIDFVPTVDTVSKDGKVETLELSWFDLKNFGSGLQMSRSNQLSGPVIWVDTNRNVFYYNDQD